MKLRDLTYEVRTYGKGRPILLLHGFTSDAGWVDHFPELDGEVFSVSLLHHGTTAPCPLKRSRMSDQVDDLVALLNTRAEPWTVIGYSLGGRVGMTLSVRSERVGHFIGISTTPGIESAVLRRERRKNDEQLATLLETRGLESFLDLWENLPLWRQTVEMKTSLRSERRRQSPTRLAQSLRAIGAGSMPPLWGQLEQLPRTSLIVGAEDSKFVAIAERMCHSRPDIALYKISDAGHAPHIENHKKFGTIIKNLTEGGFH